MIATDLERYIQETSEDNSQIQVSKVIAQNIESIELLNRQDYAGGKLTVHIVSRVPGFRGAEESRTFDILPRPMM